MLHQKILRELKGDLVQIVVVGTDKTDNPLNETENEYFGNVTTFFGIGNANIDLLKNLQSIGDLSQDQQEGDVVDGIIVAADAMFKHCKKLKYERRIYVFTCGVMDEDWKFGDEQSMKEIAQQLQEYDVRVNVIDCRTEIVETFQWNYMAQFMYMLVDEAPANTQQSGLFALDEAKQALTAYKVKGVSVLVATYKGPLEIGGFMIMVALYKRTSKVALKSMQKVALGVNDGQPLDLDREVKRLPVGQEQVEIEELYKSEIINVYSYGQNAVPLPPGYQNPMVEGKSMKLLGFIASHNVDRATFMSEVFTLMAIAPTAKPSSQDIDDARNARKFLSLLTQEMVKSDVYALIRLVATDKKAGPRMAVAFPYDESAFGQLPAEDDDQANQQNRDHDCLGLVFVPFEEDIRHWQFRPLPIYQQVTHTSQVEASQYYGSSSIGHTSVRSKFTGLEDTTMSLAPSDEQLLAMQNFIEEVQMVGENEEGQDVEMFPPTAVFNPAYHYNAECLSYRVLNEDDPLPPLDERLSAPFKRNPQVWNEESDVIQTMVRQFPSKKYVKPTKGEKRTIRVEGEVVDLEDFLQDSSEDTYTSPSTWETVVLQQVEAIAIEMPDSLPALKGLDENSQKQLIKQYSKHDDTLKKFMERFNNMAISGLQFMVDQILTELQEDDTKWEVVQIHLSLCYLCSSNNMLPYENMKQSIRQEYLDEEISEELFSKMTSWGLFN